MRHSVKVKWLLYYRQNRPWIAQVRVWGTYDGQRRPSSSFVLAVVSSLEPQLVEMLPFIVDLSNNPDQIVAALGLNFNPDTELKLMTQATYALETSANGNGKGPENGASMKVPHSAENGAHLSPTVDEKKSSPFHTSSLSAWVDESCPGKGEAGAGLVLSILAVVGAVAAFVGFAG